jgi:hypothetical protein
MILHEFRNADKYDIRAVTSDSATCLEDLPMNRSREYAPLRTRFSPPMRKSLRNWEADNQELKEFQSQLNSQEAEKLQILMFKGIQSFTQFRNSRNHFKK